MSHSHGQHHLKVRERIHQKFQKFPHPDNFIRRYDQFVTLLGCINPVFVLPQLLTIIETQSAESVALAPWLYFAVSGLAWVIYGIIHKDRAVFWVNFISLVVKIPIIIAVLCYA